MPLVIEKIPGSDGIERISIFDQSKPEEKWLKYEIDIRNKRITYYPKQALVGLRNITIDGFAKLPPEFHEKGYIKAGVEYYLNKKFSDVQVSSFVISKDAKDSVRNSKQGAKISLSYQSFSQLHSALSRCIYDNKKDKSLIVDTIFHNLFPRRFKKPLGLTVPEKTKRLMSQLDESIIEHLDNTDTQKMIGFLEKVLKKRGLSSRQKRLLFESAKIKVDEIAIDEVISKIESMLANPVSESRWGDYLEKNLFLIDARYVDVIPQLNVQLGGTRKMDFGLIDLQGYLDIFEIKLPSTPLLTSRTDRGNYCWSSQAIKAMVQAEKYLFNAESKGANLSEDLRREFDVAVKVTRPRAVVLIGQKSQLDNENKKQDFRILRSSLKNIEVILFDELLERMKLQKGKIYL
jgi:hypothetical protein